MKIPLLQIDAFADAPFKGNPAAVCLLEEPRTDAWMQNLAAEMNLSETAFLRKRPDGYDLRWFTPAVEVDLCGHATLASAHALWELGLLKRHEQARFHTRGGFLTCAQRDGLIEMDFPIEPAAPAPEAPAGLLESLCIHPVYVGKNRLDYLIEVADEATVRALAPDFARLRFLAARGVMVTAPSATPDRDFVSRYFAPGAGIDEDPVTGSAHCCLGPHWAKKLGKSELRAHQISARGGALHLRLADGRIAIGGRAVTVFIGELRI